MKQLYRTSANIIHHDNFDQYCHCTVANHASIPNEEFFDALSYHDLKDLIDDIVDPNLMDDPYSIHQTMITPIKSDFQMLSSLFGWFSAENIKRTFNMTTKFAHGQVSDTLKQNNTDIPASLPVMSRTTKSRYTVNRI
jgi:hypothetical protein